MTDTPKKRRGRPARKKKDEIKEAPAFLEEEKKKAGRPYGSKTEKRPIVEILKTPCVHCRKTKLKIVTTNPPLPVCHRVQGDTFNTLIRKLAKCGGCGKHNSINCYEIR